MGLVGNQGIRGIKGKCQIDCLTNDCSTNLKNSIIQKFNELVETKPKSLKDMRYYRSKKGMKISIDIVDPKTNIKIKTKLKNDLLEKMANSICLSNNYKTATYAFKVKKENVIEEIIKAKDDFVLPKNFVFETEENKNNKNRNLVKINSNLIKKILNNEYSMRYNKYDSSANIDYLKEEKLISDIKKMSKNIEERLAQNVDKKFNPENIQKYIIRIFSIWIELIFNSLENPYTDFFNNKYASVFNTQWKNNKNPFDEIKKYDLYEWGKVNLFRPAKIKISQDSRYTNYLPEGAKPR